jgi:hypothetical protein
LALERRGPARRPTSVSVTISLTLSLSFSVFSF